MPEYIVMDDGSLRQVRPIPYKRHAGSVLSRSEWESAVEQSKTELMNDRRQGSGESLQPTHVLQHLCRMASVDKAYAWWSAHLYAALHPDLADMPARLTEHMNQQKENT